jgi:branched-subunit amino acid transport protein
MNLWLLIFAAGIVTYAIRISMILALERLAVPDWFRRGLRFVPAAVLSAILVPELANWNGAGDLSWHNPQIIAGLISVLVAWRTRNMLATIAAGLLVFFLLVRF